MRRFHQPLRGNRRPKPQVVDGHRLDSKAEMRRYGQLKLRLMAGQIRNLKTHIRLPMVINGRKIGRGWYDLDFSYEEFCDGDWRPKYEDAKGEVDTREAHVRRNVAAAISEITIDVVSA